MEGYAYIILVVLLSFFALNFAILAFYFYIKLQRARGQNRVDPETPVTQSQTDYLTSSNDTNPPNLLQTKPHTKPDKKLKILEDALKFGDINQLGNAITVLKNQLHTPYSTTLENRLTYAEQVLEALNLKRNLEIALSLNDVWSIEAAIRQIKLSETHANNPDLLQGVC